MFTMCEFRSNDRFRTNAPNTCKHSSLLRLGHATGRAQRVYVTTCDLVQRLVATWAKFHHSVVYYNDWSVAKKTTPWVKKQDTKLLAITSLTIIRFSFFVTSRLGRKFATNSCLNIPPRFKHVTTVFCEIWMKKNDIILKYVSQLMMNHKVVGPYSQEFKVRWVTSLHIYHSLCWWNNF